jgi:uncharacterized repeat protein (TIGR03803 family)
MKNAFAVLFSGVIGCAFVHMAYAVQTASFKEKVLYSFCSQQSCTDGAEPGAYGASLLNVQGTFYGTTFNGDGTGCGGSGCGTVFAFDPKTHVEAVLHAFAGGADGAFPLTTLIDVNGTLYGTTYNGGGTGCDGSGCGTVFAVSRTTGAETIVYAFCRQANCADGEGPPPVCST